MRLEVCPQFARYLIGESAGAADRRPGSACRVQPRESGTYGSELATEILMLRMSRSRCGCVVVVGR